MPVLNYQVNAPGYGGINPKLVYIFTNDPIAEITETSYIDWLANPNGIYSGDVALIVSQETPTSSLGVGFYEFQRIGTTNHWNLVPISNSPVNVTMVNGTLNEIIATPTTGDIVVSIYPNPQIPGIASIGLPHGTTAQRAGIIGSIRFNTDTGLFEGTPDGTTWVPFASGSSGVTSITGTANEIDVSPTTGNAVVSITANPIIPGTAEVTLPAGNTAARGNRAGSIRYNTETSEIEITNDGTNWFPILDTNTGVESVTGTTNRITVTGTTNVVVDIASTYVGQNSINTLGAVTSGSWDATPITVPFGGTSATSFTAFEPICGGVTTTSVLQSVSGAGATAGNVLTYTGSSSLPTWQAGAGTSGAAKFWLVAPGNASSITNSFNVSSITHTSTGIMTINLTTPFVGTACIQVSVTPGLVVPNIPSVTSQTTSTIVVSNSATSSLSGIDPTTWYVCGFGNQ
jgi:hypothetical protein